MSRTELSSLPNGCTLYISSAADNFHRDRSRSLPDTYPPRTDMIRWLRCRAFLFLLCRFVEEEVLIATKLYLHTKQKPSF